VAFRSAATYVYRRGDSGYGQELRVATGVLTQQELNARNDTPFTRGKNIVRSLITKVSPKPSKAISEETLKVFDNIYYDIECSTINHAIVNNKTVRETIRAKKAEGATKANAVCLVPRPNTRQGAGSRSGEKGHPDENRHPWLTKRT
jgi:hypothetical protein